MAFETINQIITTSPFWGAGNELPKIFGPYNQFDRPAIDHDWRYGDLVATGAGQSPYFHANSADSIMKKEIEEIIENGIWVPAAKDKIPVLGAGLRGTNDLLPVLRPLMGRQYLASHTAKSLWTLKQTIMEKMDEPHMETEGEGAPLHEQEKKVQFNPIEQLEYVQNASINANKPSEAAKFMAIAHAIKSALKPKGRRRAAPRRSFRRATRKYKARRVYYPRRRFSYRRPIRRYRRY